MVWGSIPDGGENFNTSPIGLGVKPDSYTVRKGKGKCKGKVHPLTGHEGLEGE